MAKLIMPFSIKPEIKRSPKLSDQIVEFITAEIDSGTFNPGDYLPSEADLSVQFGVSRTVIREALGKLKYAGVLASSQGSKTKVAEEGGQRFFRMDGLEPVNLEEIGFLYEFRAILESEASALAALRRNEENIRSLCGLIEKLNLAVEKGRDATEDNINFHKEVVKASQNPFIFGFMNFLSGKIFDLVQADRNHSTHHGLPLDVQREHIKIYEAIKSGDSSKARNTTLVHLKNAAKRRGLNIL
jgi:GntR family transcriptional repressor for pyruvate dehydrogenase complex